MRLTIFSKLVIGYIVIFLITMIMSIYTNIQFNKLEKVTNSIISIHNRISSQNKKTMELLLTLVNFEKKFVIMKESDIYNHFLGAQKDFEQSLRELMHIANAEQFKNLLNLISRSYQDYLEIFQKEVEFLKSGHRYPQEQYAQEKEIALAEIMAGLKELKSYNENIIYEKLIQLEETDISARKVVLSITIFSVLCVIILSIFITRSITRPLAVMREKTREIARGNYRGDLHFSSSPEIDEVVQDFNIMCDKLKEIDKMKSDFYSFMSHELRTPVTSIKEGTTLLIEGIGGETNEKQKRILGIIAEESNRLINLINSILDLSKMEAGMMQYNFVKGDINSLLNRAVVEIEPLAKSRDIKSELHIESEVPLARMDTDKMLQVLRNLIGNAIKYSPEGGLVRISARSYDGHLEVAVSDQGPGISKENLTVIFDKFQSAHKGTGLGLAIVKNIIKSHGGKVWAENNPERGSTFIFVLPA